MTEQTTIRPPHAVDVYSIPPPCILMERITDKQLKALADAINRETGSPATAYTRLVDGSLRANVGHYHISHAYGGVCLHRMHNEAGGVTSPLSYGHVPKRELYNAMHAYLAGLRDAKRK